MLFNGSLVTHDPIRQQIRDFYRADENTVVDHLIPLADIGVVARTKAWERARQLVVEIRRQQVGKGGVDALLNEFALSTEEGVVLMCLAEALLRVPDKQTADSLIRDKLADGDWAAHIGNSDSLFVNASSWGLLMTGKLVSYSDKQKKARFGILKKAVGRLGEPVIRESVRYAMKIMGTQFVMGRTIDEAVTRAADAQTKGYTYSYDMLGEGARTMADADRYFDSYVKAIDAIGLAAAGKGPEKSPGISIKLSAIHPRYEFSHRTRVLNELVPRLKTLALQARKYDIGFTVDAEEADRLDISLDVIAAVFGDPDLDGWDGFGLALQAYQKRAIFVLDWIHALTKQTGRKMMVRLVKGAYWDSEVKISQTEGYDDFPVFSRKPATDVSYQACAKKLLSMRDTIYPQFASHNAYTVATILEMTDDHSGFEFQRLHGMGESLFDQVLQNDQVPCRVYAPVGQHADLLAYLVRRLLENGANSSFVNNIVDENIAVESLLGDPLETVRLWQDKYHPQIPLPRRLYGAERDNSAGMDLTDVDAVSQLKANLDRWFSAHHIAPGSDRIPPAWDKAVTNPANHNEVIGYLQFTTAEQMTQRLDSAAHAFGAWSATPVGERSRVLRRIADSLDSHRDELIALCIKEAGKTPADALSEIREAVDFCRYYAHQAERLLTDGPLEARGVVLCISPWNFPLAIFLGQVAAALVAGNTVLAKPAEQTSLIAIRSIELMHQCGIPPTVIQPIIAPGKQVGQHIIPDERIQAVMFTGSTQTGSWISRKLAERDGDPVPLIAETGGQNCMIVDSTALPEQVVDDVIASGFQSAGQRCSALRVLFLQHEVADKIITMLKGAMTELHVGDPACLATDVGPVIDAKALNALQAHVDYLKNEVKDKATLHYCCTIPGSNSPDQENGGHYFFAPRLYEIDSLSLLREEVFGPCIHIVRYHADQLDRVIEQINDTGFGLTMGIHTRIEAKSHSLAARSRAGNIYINRNMIGAVVGVQPFGGRGLSGTGPKAGGPLYLTRLVKEKSPADGADEAGLSATRLAQWQAGQDHSEPVGIAVNQVMTTARQQAFAWASSDLNQRISVMRQWLANLTAGGINHHQQILPQIHAQLLLIENQLGTPLQLPGPTGESNRLYLEPRGLLACWQDEASHEQDTIGHWLMAVITALAAGNTVVALIPAQQRDAAQAYRQALVKTGINSGVFQLVTQNKATAVLKHPALAGVVVDTASPMKKWLGQQLAAREHEILPLITARSHLTLLQRVISEKTISIDTTAAGGNASLMTMQMP